MTSADEAPMAGKTEMSAPGLMPPEAIRAPSPETNISGTGPRRRATRAQKETKVIRCQKCNGFLAKVTVPKSKSFEGLFRCHRCKTMNSFVF